MIRKGRNYDIYPGAPVVYTGGIVGRVREVHAYTSVVDLVSSPMLEIVYADSDGQLHVFDFLGNPLPGFPVTYMTGSTEATNE